jgi:hypothetical protein
VVFLIEFLGGSLLSIIICYFLLWAFVVSIVWRARKNRKDSRVEVVQYDIPEVSPVLARHLMVSGRMGGMAGEISQSGLQTIMMIDLYENGALKRLEFIGGSTFEYEIAPDVTSLNLKEEQVIFLNLLKEKVGMSGTLRELADMEGNSREDGFSGVTEFWFDYWNKDLRNLCLERGYFNREGALLNNLTGALSGSMTIGFFVAVFLYMIPGVGQYLTLIPLFPVAVVMSVSVLMEKVLFLVLGKISVIASIHALPLDPFWGGVAIIFFVTWFVWFLCIGQNQATAATTLGESGKNLVWRLNGYKSFLKKVDARRLSFSLDKDLDFQRNNTTFAWLAIFSLAKDAHWDAFMEVHGKKSGGMPLM